MSNSDQAPYETEFREFESLAAKKDYRRAYDLFWDSPGILFWMNSTDVAHNAAQALNNGLNLDRAFSIYNSAKEFSRSLGRIARINDLRTLVEKCELASDDKDGTNYWQRYNKFLAQVKAGSIRNVPCNVSVYSYIPLGVSVEAYHLLTGDKQSNFGRLVQQNMDDAEIIILTDMFIKTAINFDEKRNLPPNMWNF